MDVNMEDMPDRIMELFADQEILITGATGFIGKVFIEKLMRDVAKFGKIYAIVRARKGKSSQQRLDDALKSQLFDKVRKERDFEVLRKSVIAIDGDVSVPHLGISDEDREMLCERVNIVYHIAATVRFDELLKTTVFLNTRGTRDMLNLAKEMKQLKLFVHVSTAFSQITVKVVEEKIYPGITDPHKIIKCMETLSDDVIEALTPKILGQHPNPYSFTKALAEDLVGKAMQHIPAIIVRPSIVMPTWKEPMPGWSDNMNGPTGLLIGAGKGVIRTMYIGNDGFADMITVDILINGLMVLTWYNLCVDNSRVVFNATNNKHIKITWKQVVDIGRLRVRECPLEQMIWIPGGIITESRLLFNVTLIFFHLIPACIIDMLIFLAGYKPVMFRVHCRINKGFRIFEYYTGKEWNFKHDNVLLIIDKMNAREKTKYYIKPDNVNLIEYYDDCIRGTKLYILNEPLERVPTLRHVLKIMYGLDVALKILFYGLLVYLLYCSSETARSLWTSIWSIGTKALSF